MNKLKIQFLPCAEEVQCLDVTAIVDPMASRYFLSIERNSYSSIHSLTKVFTLRSYLDIVQYINSRKYISRFHKGMHYGNSFVGDSLAFIIYLSDQRRFFYFLLFTFPF